MYPSIFQFGQLHPDYAVPVLNERAVRASAGLLLLAGLVAFMNAWLVGNFALTRVFVVVFLVDFSIRIWVNPRFSPTLVDPASAKAMGHETQWKLHNNCQ